MLNLLHQQFIQYAFIAGTIVAIMTAIVGYFVVLRAQAFAAHSLAHIGFAGATGAAIVGISSLVGTLLFTIVAALGMGVLGKRIQGRDIEIGMILSFALGLGVLFLKLYTSNAAETVNILFGSILSVTNTDIFIILITGVISLVTISIVFRPLLFSSIDPEVAQARGVPINFLSIVFMVILGITVAQAVQVVGILLVFALLVAPAATAQHICKRPLTALLTAIGLGILFTWGGLFLSLFFHWPVSFFIAFLASITYLITVQGSHYITPHFYQPLPHDEKEV